MQPRGDFSLTIIRYPAVVDVPRDVQFGLPAEVDEAVETLRDIKLFNNHAKNCTSSFVQK